MRSLLLIPVLTLASLNGLSAEFVMGKVPPAEFDMPELNGDHIPADAVRLCDSDPICAGFTYRGLYDNRKFPGRKYEIYFFRFIHYVDGTKEYANWVTYKTKKLYGKLVAGLGTTFPNFCSGISAV